MRQGTRSRGRSTDGRHAAATAVRHDARRDHGALVVLGHAGRRRGVIPRRRRVTRHLTTATVGSESQVLAVIVRRTRFRLIFPSQLLDSSWDRPLRPFDHTDARGIQGGSSRCARSYCRAGHVWRQGRRRWRTRAGTPGPDVHQFRVLCLRLFCRLLFRKVVGRSVAQNAGLGIGIGAAGGIRLSRVVAGTHV